MATTETKPSYSPGLAGVIAGETSICWVDPNAGLMYRGYDIHKVAQQANFEEVAYLLLHGELPSAQQLMDFGREIASQRELPAAVLEMLRLLPKTMHPMDVLRTGVSMLAAFDPDLNDHSHEGNLRKAIRLIARVSTLVTDGWRISQGLDPIADNNDLTHAGNFLYKLTGNAPETWQVRMLDTIFILYADHEFNASTFAARVTASTLADMYAACTSACGTLKGPLHGGANEESIYMLEAIREVGRAEEYVHDLFERGEKIMGFGHRVYRRVDDPRATILKRLAKEMGEQLGEPQWFEIAERVDQVVREEKGLRPNVDFYAGALLHYLGLPTDLFTPMFAAARASGWTAHIREQYADNRIIRPDSEYIGPRDQRYVPVEERELEAAS